MLKLKEGFILSHMGGENMVFPSGADMDLSVMIKLNDTGAFLWKQLEQGTDKEALIHSVLEHYPVDRSRAEHAVEAFLNDLQKHDCLVSYITKTPRSEPLAPSELPRDSEIAGVNAL